MPRGRLDKQKYEAHTAVDSVGVSACIPEVGVALFIQEFGTEPLSTAQLLPQGDGP